jgi:hypothetical protein
MERFGILSIAELDEWPDVEAGALTVEALEDYLHRKHAIQAYLAGATGRDMMERHNVTLRWVVDILRDRCLQAHTDGRIFGWRGAVRYARRKPYHRTKPVKTSAFGLGAAGAMGLLLALEPDFKQRLDNYILKTVPNNQIGEIKKPNHAIWSWFLKGLRELGYEARNQWPFNVETRGYSSVVRYADALLKGNPKVAAMLTGGMDAVKKLSTGDGRNRPDMTELQRVEMDAHKLDCRLCVMIPQSDGDWSPKIVHRLWVIVIVHVASRAVLGYYLSLRREVDKNDVLATIKCALSRWLLPEMQFCQEELLPDAGLPSSHAEHFLGLCWNETSVDGALAQTCATVQAQLLNVVGSTLVNPSAGYPARRSKDDRPFVERYFAHLSSGGFGRLSISTGSSPKGRKGRKPEEVAVVSQFQLPYLEELLAATIANYNATPISSLGHRSPLTVLDFLYSKNRLPERRADQKLVQALMSVRQLCVVKGGVEQGRRVYVNFGGARYSSDSFGARFDLAGKQVWITNHLDNDSRIALASTTSGEPLGVLMAAPPWHRLPHSLVIRRSINSMIHNRRFTVAEGGDAVSAFMQYCAKHAKTKLPLHPTYLAIQRVLAEHEPRKADEAPAAQKMGGASNAKNPSRSLEKKPIPKSDPSALDESNEKISSPTKAATRRLPQLRIAANK